MTVSGETSTVAAVDRDAADQLFNDIYGQHFDRLRQYLYFRLPLDKVHLAEDFAQEAFADLWCHLLNGRPVTRAYGLLRKIALAKMNDYYRVKSNLEYKAVDFDDPEASPVTTSHRYAAADPAMAPLTAELDQAMARMQNASAEWRDLHKKSYVLDRRIADGYDPDPEPLVRSAEALKRDRNRALGQLRKACGAVGALRAELERIGGPNWKSSSGLPASTMSDGKARAGSVASDVSRTHCDAGHLLDLENSSFSEEGRRRCRKCSESGKRRVRKGTPNLCQPTPQSVLDGALAVLLDPANSHRTVKDLAPEIGLSANTLHRRFPNLAARRRAALEQAALPSGAAR